MMLGYSLPQIILGFFFSSGNHYNFLRFAYESSFVNIFCAANLAIWNTTKGTWFHVYLRYQFKKYIQTPSAYRFVLGIACQNFNFYNSS